MQITRRDTLIGAAVVAVSAAIPALPALAATDPEAMMLFTTDEPWGAVVRGHVSDDAFRKVVADMLESDSDLFDNGEEWLCSHKYYEDDERIVSVIEGASAHRYMRVSRTDDPDLGTAYRLCEPEAAGAFPVTVVMY